MKKIAKTISLLLVLAVLLSACNFSANKATRLDILSDDYVTINPGETMILEIDSDYRGNVTWSSDDENVATVDRFGVVTGVSEGIAVIMVSGGGLFDMVSVKVSQSKTELTLTSPSKTVAVGQSVNLQVTVLPAELTEKVSLHIADGSAFATLNGKTLTGVAPGKVVVVASVDDVVAAETITVVQSADVDEIVLTASAQTAKVGQSVNEPLLPENNGYGGNKYYYEIDIGLSGYNNGNKITRGAARIVYARYKGGMYAQTTASERYVFYTYNHYEDFQEYLNYKGGWGKRFGYETSNYTSPTDYVQVNLYDFTKGTSPSAINAWFDKN